MDNEERTIERTFKLPKYTLLEIGPLYPFLMDRSELRIIEVGANVGLWCEAFHSVFAPKIASYLAFEPMPGNAAAFRGRLESHLPDAAVQLVEACAGAERGTMTIYYDDEVRGDVGPYAANGVTTLASVAVSRIEREDGTVLVNNRLQRPTEMVRLDDCITEPVDLVKIDTEGYEWSVIAGMEGAIDAGMVDNIYFEFGRHQRHLGQTFRQFFEYFTGRGWRVFRQTVGRNYFGLNEITKYNPQFEDMADLMFMILATRSSPSDRYMGPRVVGRIN